MGGDKKQNTHSMAGFFVYILLGSPPLSYQPTDCAANWTSSKGERHRISLSSAADLDAG
jgi:hypothetical protein